MRTSNNDGGQQLSTKCRTWTESRIYRTTIKNNSNLFRDRRQTAMNFVSLKYSFNCTQNSSNSLGNVLKKWTMMVRRQILQGSKGPILVNAQIQLQMFNWRISNTFDVGRQPISSPWDVVDMRQSAILATVELRDLPPYVMHLVLYVLCFLLWLLLQPLLLGHLSRIVPNFCSYSTWRPTDDTFQAQHYRCFGSTKDGPPYCRNRLWERSSP